MFLGVLLGMLVSTSLIHANLEHPPSSSCHEVCRVDVINDNMIAVIHRTALGISFKSWKIRDITRVQRGKLYSFEHVHVCSMADVLPASNKIIQELNDVNSTQE